MVDLLLRVIMSSIVSLFMGFHGDSNAKVQFNNIIKSNHVRQFNTDMKSYVSYVFFYY